VRVVRRYKGEERVVLRPPRASRSIRRVKRRGDGQAMQMDTD
jgi:hypothetical protein